MKPPNNKTTNLPTPEKSGEIFSKNIEKGHSLSSRESIFAAWKEELTINNYAVVFR